MEKVRIGIVGTGFISGFHYNGFKNNTDAQIVGMCTHSNREKLKHMCEGWGIKAYGCFDEMVQDPKLDALIIGSINPDHYPQIMTAIDQGKHVLAEKPVVTDVAQVDEILHRSKEKGVLVFPGHNFVYRKAVQQAKELLAENKLGRVTYASFISTHTISQEHSRGWRSKNSLSCGGALMDSGHHLTYMSLYLMGMPARISAFKSNLVLNRMEGEDLAQVNMVYPDGAIGCLMQSWTSNHGNGINGVKLVGDRGELQITDALYLNGCKLSEDVDYADSFANQAKAFTDCILKGSEPLSTLQDVKNTLGLIYAAYESTEKSVAVSF